MHLQSLFLLTLTHFIFLSTLYDLWTHWCLTLMRKMGYTGVLITYLVPYQLILALFGLLKVTNFCFSSTIYNGMVSTTFIFPPPSGGIQTLKFNNVYLEHSLLNMQISEIRHHVFFNHNVWTWKYSWFF